jgi:hypothetical protein
MSSKVYLKEQHEMQRKRGFVALGTGVRVKGLRSCLHNRFRSRFSTHAAAAAAAADAADSSLADEAKDFLVMFPKRRSMTDDGMKNYSGF